MSGSEIHFPPKIVNVDIDDVCHGVPFKPPDLLDNRGGGHGPPRIAHEKFKERILLGAERDSWTATMNSVSDAFDLDSGKDTARPVEMCLNRRIPARGGCR